MPEVNGSDSNRKLTPFEQRDMQRALALGEEKRSVIARRFGVSASYVTQFARRYARQIDDIKRDIDNEFAGLWIASKVNRVIAYQADFAKTLTDPKASHHEWVKARAMILHQVAEELGQLPPRASGTITQPVEVRIIGVNIDLI